MSEQKLRLGIIGLGLITQTVHLQHIVGALSDRVTVTHVCDLSASVAEAIGIELGARWSTEIDTLLSDDAVDAVLICTPKAHSAVARPALEKGKHVFAEKPYSYDPEIARRDAAFAAEHGLVLQVGYMKMYEPAIEEARRRFGDIGTLRLVRMTVLHPSSERQTEHLPIKRGSDIPADLIAAGAAANQAEISAALEGIEGVDPILFRSVLHGSVCHQTAVLRALFPDGNAMALHARQDAPGHVRQEPPKLQVTGTIENGPDWSLSWNWLTNFPEYQEWVEIYGDNGSIRIDFPPPYKKAQLATVTTLIAGSGSESVRQIWEPTGGNAFQRELEAFAAAIATKGAVLSDATGVARDAELLRDIATLLA